MTSPDTDTLAGLREELRLIGCHQNGEARCTCAIGADAVDAIDALRAQAAKDKARIERLESALRPFSIMAGEMFARNWNKDGVAISFVGKDGPIRLTFTDFLAARAALEDGE